MPAEAAGGDVRGAIEQIEARIEALAEQIVRCRKISFASKLSIAAGAAWIVLTLLRVAPFEPAVAIAALAALIGGTVLLGSNATTWTQTEEALRAAEAMRAELIGSMEMRTVGDESRTVH